LLLNRAREGVRWMKSLDYLKTGNDFVHLGNAFGDYADG